MNNIEEKLQPQVLKRAYVKRILHRADGMLGVFIFDGFPVCVTLELPWKANHRDQSCIPALSYLCKRIQSVHHGNTFEVTGVPNRTQILFHTANRIADLLGCIGLAEFFYDFNGTAGIANPFKGAGMQEFTRRTAGVNQFTLIIEEHLNA